MIKIEGFLKLITPLLIMILPSKYAFLLFFLINILALIRSYGII